MKKAWNRFMLKLVIVFIKKHFYEGLEIGESFYCWRWTKALEKDLFGKVL